MLIAAAALAGAAPGQAVYENVCMACHAAENVMVAAPKFRDGAEWRRRLDRSPKGVDTLTDHALAGLGAMPAKGGREELTRDEVKAAILFMMGPREPTTMFRNK
jgi:cytochrome c oxidase cbb3-type subunit 3